MCVQTLDMFNKFFMVSVVAFGGLEAGYQIALTWTTIFVCVLLTYQPYIRRLDDVLHLLVEIELLNLTLVAYVLNTLDAIELDPTVDVLLSILLIMMCLSVFGGALALTAKTLWGMWLRRERRKMIEYDKRMEEEENALKKSQSSDSSLPRPASGVEDMPKTPEEDATIM